MRVHCARMIACGLLWLVGCGSMSSSTGGLDVPGHTPGTPGLGAHGLSFFHVGESDASSIATPTMATQSEGSTIIVAVGRGNNTLFNPSSAVPRDNKSNAPYQQQGKMQPYEHPNEFSGTALYSLTSAKGGSGFAVHTTTGLTTDGNHDEITMAAVEVIEGTRIQAYAWNEVVQPQGPAVPVTSDSVTTTGPATLIAFWWGDATAMVDQTITANNGFAVVDSVLLSGSVIQCAVAVKNVTDAGTYDVTWAAKPEQGAQLWLVAVQ
jgi:hypothetical protein